MEKSEVRSLQRALRETVALSLVVDGVWGAGTDTALAQFAKTSGVSTTEAKELLRKYAELRFVSEEAFKQAASSLGVPQSYVRAIAKVESAGESFLKDGRLKILFERHWFRRKLYERLQTLPEVRRNVAAECGVNTPADPRAADTLLALVEKKFPEICCSERGGYKGGEAEWARLEQAMDLDVEAAALATSFGGYQLMGFNHKACGYKSAQEMMLALAASESKQFLALVAFIKDNTSLHSALKRADWAKFAELYNGSAYKENKYDTKMSAAEKENQIYNA